MRVSPGIRRCAAGAVIALGVASAMAQTAAPPVPPSPQSAAGLERTSGVHALDLPTNTVPEGYAGVPYRGSIRAEGGVGEYHVAVDGALPPGILYQPGLGVITFSGVPLAAGIFEARITLVDSFGASTQHSYTFNVHPNFGGCGCVIVADPESITTSDNDHVFFPAVVKVAESITTSDGIYDLFGHMRDIENITTTDTVSILLGSDNFVSEPVHINDATSVTAKLGIIPTTAPAGMYGVPYSQTFTTVGAIVLSGISLTSGTLPAGITVTAFGLGYLTISGTPTQAGSFPFTLTAEDFVNTSAVNYTLVIVGTSQTITVGTLPTPTYGGAPFSLSATSTSGLPVTITPTGGPVTGSGNGPYTITGAGTATFQATQAGSNEYNAAPPVNFAVTIAPATLLVTATNASRAYDAPNPTFTYSIGPFVNGDPSTVVSGVPTLTTTAVGTSPPGQYPISVNVSGLSAANYVFTGVNGVLTINAGAAQTIIFPQPPTLTAGQTYHLAAFTTSGLAVTYTVSGDGSLSGDYVTAGSSGGTITITAQQTGSGNYAAATSVVRSFNVQ